MTTALTDGFQKHLVILTLAASLAASATIVARAAEWWVPAGARETARIVRVDGVTEHRLILPDGGQRVVAIGATGATRRLVQVAEAAE